MIDSVCWTPSNLHSLLQKKVLAPEQLFFISSTVSNKIFIGDPEEEELVTEPTVVEEEQSKESSRFSSFPIRGLNTLVGKPG